MSTASVLVGSSVVQSFKRDFAFNFVSAETQKALEPFALELPNVIGEYLEQPLGLGNFLKAKIAFLKYQLENGWFEALVASYSEKQLQGLSRDKMTEIIKNGFSEQLKVVETIAANPEAYLQEQGVSEEAFLSNPHFMRLNLVTRELQKTGQLTIRALVEFQPSLLILNVA